MNNMDRPSLSCSINTTVNNIMSHDITTRWSPGEGEVYDRNVAYYGVDEVQLGVRGSARITDNNIYYEQT